MADAPVGLADSVVANCRAGEGRQVLRAAWPFIHPVGTGHYFVVPFFLSLAGAFDASRRGSAAV